MTNTKRTLKGLLAALLSLAMTVAMCVSMFASAADTATETVVIRQKIEKGPTPSITSYTYLLTPLNTAPLPKELAGKPANSKGQYEIGTITGDSTDKTELTLTFEIEKAEPGTFVYYLEKTPGTPAGETFNQEKWQFGFRVKVDEQTGELVAFPEVCDGAENELSDYDAYNYPAKLTMINSIKGKTTTTSTITTTTTTKKGQTTRTYTTYRNGTTGTTTRGRYVNTGDESQLLLWVVVLGVAVAGLLVVILLRKRRDNDDEENC